MKSYSIVFALLLLCLTACKQETQPNDYAYYHDQVIVAETFISENQYAEALQVYDDLNEDFEFVFLRDLQVASQLALQVGDKEKAIAYIQKGFAHGWDFQATKEHPFLNKHLRAQDWEQLENTYDDYNQQFVARIDTNLRQQVKVLFDRDQRMAYQAAVIEEEVAQEAFIREQFPALSKQQLERLSQMIETAGYPGERLIGNFFWASTILSHHNSIAPDIVSADTLYPSLRPKLLDAVKQGYMSPYDFALIEDWKQAVISEWASSEYGYVNPPTTASLPAIDQRRAEIGLRSVNLRNQLIDLSSRTGMNFILPDWVEGKIVVKANN